MTRKKIKRIYRCRWDKKVAGVLGGLGQYLNIDPTILRLAFVFLAIITGILPFIVGYILATLLIPRGPSVYIKPNCKKLFRLQRGKKIAGICAGLSDFFQIDPTLIRIILIVLCVITGFFPVIISYMIGSAIIPLKFSK